MQHQTVAVSNNSSFANFSEICLKLSEEHLSGECGSLVGGFLSDRFGMHHGVPFGTMPLALWHLQAGMVTRLGQVFGCMLSP